jgi:hypothetical protein
MYESDESGMAIPHSCLTKHILKLEGYGYGVLPHFQQYFSYIVAVLKLDNCLLISVYCDVMFCFLLLSKVLQVYTCEAITFIYAGMLTKMATIYLRQVGGFLRVLRFPPLIKLNS